MVAGGLFSDRHRHLRFSHIRQKSDQGPPLNEQRATSARSLMTNSIGLQWLRNALRGFGGAWLALSLLSACSGSDDSDTSDGAGGSPVNLSQGGNGVGSGNSGNTGNYGNGGGVGLPTSNGCEDTSSETCAGLNFEVESIPLDIYVMFDQSGSMLNDVGGLTRLQAVQLAVARFLRDPNSAGIGVGIGYFGFQPIGKVSCDASVYENPDVPVSRDHEAVVASLDKRMPTGETPTAAALEGACTYAEGYKAQNPNHAVVILLVTDGKPEAPVSCGSGGCCPLLEDATARAHDCLTGRGQIPTYVLGVGPNLDNLHAIAQAGGTKSAYLVGDKDVTNNVLAALNSIRRAAQIPCQFEIPTSSGGTVDLAKVNVLYAQGGCDFTPLYHVSRADACEADGGWFFDNPNSPSFIKLCSNSCELVGNTGSALKVSVGCATVEPPIR